MDEVVVALDLAQRFNMLLMSVFGASALLLSAIGIYGLMAYSVEQRTQEIGIRLALGAELGAVRRMILGQGMLLAAIGIGDRRRRRVRPVALHRFVPLWRQGLGPDGLRRRRRCCSVAVALLATWIPALRAIRVDPVDALRGE